MNTLVTGKMPPQSSFLIPGVLRKRYHEADIHIRITRLLLTKSMMYPVAGNPLVIGKPGYDCHADLTNDAIYCCNAADCPVSRIMANKSELRQQKSNKGIGNT